MKHPLHPRSFLRIAVALGCAMLLVGGIATYAGVGSGTLSGSVLLSVQDCAALSAAKKDAVDRMYAASSQMQEILTKKNDVQAAYVLGKIAQADAEKYLQDLKTAYVTDKNLVAGYQAAAAHTDVQSKTCKTALTQHGAGAGSLLGSSVLGIDTSSAGGLLSMAQKAAPQISKLVGGSGGNGLGLPSLPSLPSGVSGSAAAAPSGARGAAVAAVPADAQNSLTKIFGDPALEGVAKDVKTAQVQASANPCSGSPSMSQLGGLLGGGGASAGGSMGNMAGMASKAAGALGGAGGGLGNLGSIGSSLGGLDMSKLLGGSSGFSSLNMSSISSITSGLKDAPAGLQGPLKSAAADLMKQQAPCAGGQVNPAAQGGAAVSIPTNIGLKQGQAPAAVNPPSLDNAGTGQNTCSVVAQRVQAAQQNSASVKQAGSIDAQIQALRTAYQNDPAADESKKAAMEQQVASLSAQRDAALTQSSAASDEMNKLQSEAARCGISTSASASSGSGFDVNSLFNAGSINSITGALGGITGGAGGGTASSITKYAPQVMKYAPKALNTIKSL